MVIGNQSFAFGENWADFARHIDERNIVESENGILNLIGRDKIEGRTFFDIGCGSGLHSLAACRLGAKRVVAIDVDHDSVETARAVLERHASSADWSVERGNILEAGGKPELFDIVYSWGVLHHTGNLDLALRNAAAHVKPGGLFVFSLYRRTKLDAFWIAEKRWYSAASERAQSVAQSLYMLTLRAGLLATGRSFKAHEASYVNRRGLSMRHDIHDWLGGWPYEPISTHQVNDLLNGNGFERLKEIAQPEGLGLLGSGCDEYVFRKAA